MQKTLSHNTLVVNSENLDSIQKFHQSELKRQAFQVRSQEFLRDCANEEKILGRDLVLPPSDLQFPLDFSAPRTCNTGALIPSAKIDWLEFTVTGVAPGFACSEYLDLDFDAFGIQDFGMQGYPDSAQYGKILVLWSERKPERGTKVILSAQALDQAGRDAVEIIRLVLRDGGTFARIDCAIDDRRGNTTIQTVIDAVDSCEDVTRFSQVEVRQPMSRATRQFVGRSVYWGKASSSRQVVAYDKELEQRHKTGEETGPWLRFEARWKKRAANLAAAVLAESGMDAIPSMMRGVLDFRKNDDPRIDRRSLCDWWESIVGQVTPIKTGIRKVIKTIEEKASWLGRSVSKTMGQVAALMGVDTIVEMVRAGAYATEPREWKQLDPTGQRVLLNSLGQLDLVIPF